MGAVRFAMIALFAAFFAVPLAATARAEGAADAAIPQDARIEPAAFVDQLRGTNPPATILQVGSSVLYAEAHIPGSQYAGPTGKEDGIKNLASHVDGLPRDKPIVIYCGCCPWTRCPNIGAAYKHLLSMGFTHVKALYLPNNFGDDWVNKGYPVARGN